MTQAANPVMHGFPHIDTVHAALTALYRRLSYETMSSFAVSVCPDDVAFPAGEDLFPGAQRVARSLVRHYRLPEARMIVAFRAMEQAGNVELDSGPEYFVELHERFRTDRRDIGAVLAHEVTHVFLHRLGLRFTDTYADEILTDTAAAYLGAGRPLLDSYREEPATSGDRLTTAASKLGYLTPEEFGYVLAKRGMAFGEDVEPWLTGPQARDAYRAGLHRAREDWRRPPLLRCGRVSRHRYTRDRRTGTGAGDGYAFEGGPETLRVSFPCPACHQRIRLPVRGRVTARCGTCRTVLECDT